MDLGALWLAVRNRGLDDDGVATLLGVAGSVVRTDLDRARRALRALLVEELAAADVVDATASA